jgi:hypothetical protein
VAEELGADLDQLFLQAGQRPVLDRLRRCQRAQEVAEIVGKREASVAVTYFSDERTSFTRFKSKRLGSLCAV